jgi:predicted porin
MQRKIMKKLAVLAVLATAAVAANAQSTVTLFGVADVAMRNVKNGDNSVQSLTSGGINTSRLGFRGVEDLGGGLRAGFWLESGLNMDSGTAGDTAGRFWNRRSTASLSGQFGEVRLGRDFSPSYSAFTDFDVFGDNGVAAGGKFFNKLGTTVDTNTRADNLVSYFLPAMGGVYGQVAVAAGEGTSGKKYMGGRIGYAAGPLNLNFGYGTTSVTPLVAGADKYKVATVGASYDLGVAKLQGYYSQNKYAAQKVATYSLGASMPVGTVGVLKAAYTSVNAKGTGIDANDAHQFALGYVYNLTKRTALYTTVAKINNKGNAAYVVDGNPALANPSKGADSTGYEFGMRHAF